MFGFGPRTTRGALAKAELSEGIDHLKRAATHAANDAGTAMAPRINAAREAVAPTAAKVRNSAASGWASTTAIIVPLAVAAVGGARQPGAADRKARSQDVKAMRKKSSRRTGRRWPRLVGLLLAGTAVGAGSAVALRRRGQQQWDEYDPGQTLDAVREGAGPMPSSTLADPTRAKSGSTMAGGSPGSGAEGSSSSAGSAPASTEQVAKGAQKAGGVLSNATGQSRSSRN